MKLYVTSSCVLKNEMIKNIVFDDSLSKYVIIYWENHSDNVKYNVIEEILDK